MKEAFEKIVERLEKKIHHLHTVNWNAAFEEAIEIVNQVAEEYSNDGWIPCSSGKYPDTDREVLVSCRMKKHEEDEECILGVSSWVDVRVGAYELGYKDWAPAWDYWGRWEVVAWMPIVPYKVEG